MGLRLSTDVTYRPTFDILLCVHHQKAQNLSTPCGVAFPVADIPSSYTISDQSGSKEQQLLEKLEVSAWSLHRKPNSHYSSFVKNSNLTSASSQNGVTEPPPEIT